MISRHKIVLVLLFTLATLAAALTGFACGKYGNQSATGLSLGQAAFLYGGLLALAGLCGWPPTPKRQRRDERLVAVWMIAYLAVSAVGAPLDVENTAMFLITIAWLSPLVVGGVSLPIRQCWWTASACWAVLFSGMTALGYNFSHVYSGTGFLLRWLA